MRPAAADFAREAGIAVAVATDHGHNIEALAMAGSADADVIAVPAAMMTRIVRAGCADAGKLVEIGAVRIGAAVHEAAPRVDVSRSDTLRDALLAAGEVLLTNAPTGEHLERVLAKLGVEREIAPRIRRFDTATQLHEYIAGNPDAGALGFGPTTEILAWRGRGIAMNGTLPDAIQIVLPYQAGMLNRTRSADRARKLLGFLATPPARKHFRDSGVE
jgi:molybdate transport system substrate-binding protein